MSPFQIVLPFGRRLRAVFPWLVILLPLGVYLVFLPRFGAIQNNDYFGSITKYLGGEYEGELARAKQYLLGRSNEHRIAVPMLVYHTSFVLTRGSNRPLSVFALLMMGVVFAVLYRLLPQQARRPPPRQILFGFLLAAFCFTPVAAHNVAMGFSGTMWFLANVAFVSALAVLVRRGPRRGTAALWSVGLFGLVGLFSYSTSLAMWPALIVAALCLRLSWRKIVGLATLAALSYGYYFATYAIPQTEPNTSDAGAALTFFGIYLGGLFTREAASAVWIGWGGVAAAAVLLVYVLRWRRDRLAELAPWIAIQCFGLVNAVGTSIGRSGFGDGMAVSSRYATLPGFFWAGLLVVAGLLMVDAKAPSFRRQRALAALFGVFLTLAIPMWARGIPLLESFANRAQHQRLAELALVLGHYDPHALGSLSPVPGEVWRARPMLIRLGHRPFDRPRPSLPVVIEPRAKMPHPRLRGAVNSRARTENGTLRPAGWAVSDGADVAAMAVTAVDGHVIGELVLGLPTPQAARRQGAQERYAGWAGYVISGSAESLRIFVRLEGDPLWYPLPGQ